jgi:eukaryotic-like serine/threonine-protein kinase
MDFLIGRTLSHYRVVEKIGAGGMGVVYRARDERLQRDVALKVLPMGALADEAAHKQFRREALALSKLNHSNIATVHDFDSQEGVDFLVLELVSGETLAERVRRGPLPEKEIARLGEQLAEGLTAAHKQGVLHRDIKPANLRVTPEGRLKVLDFGLARLIRVDDVGAATATATGSVAGTAPYMSPEQLRGEVLDERADLWAAGAVLYELSTGHPAFEQQPQARLITAILQEAVVPPREAGARVSPELERITLKCLEKDPEDRYQSAQELAVDLRRLLAPSAVSQPRQSRAQRRKSHWLLAGGAAIVLFAFATLLFGLDIGGIRTRISGIRTPIVPSLAVLPLANLSGDASQEYFADGMTDELITRLAQISALKVISRTSAMQYKGTRKSSPEIAHDLGVRMLVEGTVQRSGDRVRISAQLIDAASDRNLWAESFEKGAGDVFAIQSEVARAIVGRIAVRLTPKDRTRLAVAHPVNPAAHEEYLKGQFELNFFTSEGAAKARDHYLHAIEIDPGYGPAHAGIAWSYIGLSNVVLPPREAMPRARAAALAALALDSTLAEAHGALGYVTAFYDWDWRRAEQELRESLALFSGSARPHQNYGYYLTVVGRFEEGLREFQRAHELDPLEGYISSQLLWPLYEGRRYDQAIAAAQSLLQTSPNLWDVDLILGQAYAKRGAHREAIAAFERCVAMERSQIANLAYGYAMAGNKNKALAVLREAEQSSGRGYISPYIAARVRGALGDKDRAFAALERGLRERSEDMVFLKVDPALDPLRSDPRFNSLLKRMGFKS